MWGVSQKAVSRKIEYSAGSKVSRVVSNSKVNVTPLKRPRVI